MSNKILIVGMVVIAFVAIIGILFGVMKAKKSEPTQLDLSTITAECNKAPSAPSSGYTRLLTDVHVHLIQDSPNKQIEFAKKLIEEMNVQGVDRVVVQHNHNPNPDRAFSKMRDIEELWGKISSACPRIITLLYAFNPDNASDFDYIKQSIETDNFGGVGEIDFQHGGFTHLKHNPESDTMNRIYDLLEQKGLAIHFQAQLNVDPSLEEKIFRVVSTRPNLNFVWFGCLADEKFLKLANLFCNQFVHAQSREHRQEILTRSIIGSDAGPAGFWNPAYGLLPYKSFGEAMAQARAELAKLPVEVADKLAHANFDKVWPKP